MPYRNALGFIAVMLFVVGCQRILPVQGSGHPRTESRTVSNFDAIDVSGGIRAIVNVGGPSALTITADDNIVPLIATDVSGTTLRIHTTRSVSSRSELTAQITVPALTSVATSGGTNVTVTAVHTQHFHVDASGGSNLLLSGNAEDFDADLSGGVRLVADGLLAQRVHIDASGGVRADVHALREVHGSLSGGVAVTVAGNPPVRDVRTSGAANVRYQ